MKELSHKHEAHSGHPHEHHHEHHHEHEEYVAHECDGTGHQHHHHEDGTCCCEHHAKEFHGIDKKMLARLILAALCYLAVELLPVGETIEIVLLVACALLAGYDIVLSAAKNLLKARVFDEYFLMSFAAVAAFVIGEFEEGAAVFLLYRIGAFCQSYAIRHSRKTICGIAGDEGNHESEASSRFITRFAGIYTPVILAMAVVIAVLLPLVGDTTVKESVYRALTFLVLACPCAIVISVPMAYFAGIAAASRRGIYFRNSSGIEALTGKSAVDCTVQSHTAEGKTNYFCAFDGSADPAKAEFFMDQADGLSVAKKIAAKTRAIVLENVWFTILVKVTVLVLSVCGISALWFAVFADSGVTVIVVLNSLRAFRVGQIKK